MGFRDITNRGQAETERQRALQLMLGGFKTLDNQEQTERERAFRKGRLEEDRLRREQDVEFRKRQQDEIERANRAREGAAKREKSSGKQLSAMDVKRIQEGATVPTLLEDVNLTLDDNNDIFGPLEGTVRSFNPYDERAKTIDAQMRATSQAFGRYMEGGVLRKEDEEKYRKMFPALSDTPAVAKNKLAVVSRLLAKKQNSDLDALKASGFDVSGISRPKMSELPRVLTRAGRAKAKALQAKKSPSTFGMSNAYADEPLPPEIESNVKTFAEQNGVSEDEARMVLQIRNNSSRMK